MHLRPAWKRTTPLPPPAPARRHAMTDRHTELLRCVLPEGGALSGKLSFRGAPGPDAVLFVHGFGSTHAGEKSAALESACARRGWTYAAFDFRGHGASPGTL